MKRLQTTQKRAYTSPIIEVLEAENDMSILTTSIQGSRALREDFEEDDTDGFKEP